MEPPDALVAMRATDAEFVTRGTSYAFTCADCQAVVCIAPSSRTIIREHPAMLILCTQCMNARVKQLQTALSVEAVPGALEEIKTAEPNRYRQRN